MTIPLESQIHAQLVVKQSALADAINQMRGIGSSASYTDTIAPLYVRATAMIANQPSTFIASNVVTLAEVKGIPFFAAGSTAPTDVLYTPGNPNGWSFDACMMIPASGDNVYEGYLAVDGDFKFTQNPSWDNPATTAPANSRKPTTAHGAASWWKTAATSPEWKPASTTWWLKSPILAQLKTRWWAM